ncbi:DUF1579 domain-containing protein [Novosphingobium sp. 9U]|uniref:DUF1579 domain-containing protein n=1 Tax=Novosphingobium sp. 9U TaxID=2653158 RepID=UPI001359200D|nr:DUF1579 domain-containing protein [Novosphingobium sp. 9U]
MRFACAAALAAVSVSASAQVQAPDAGAQKAGMEKLAALDGEWRGHATVLQSGGGAPLSLVHTERVGTMLDGTIRIIEGRSYKPDGSAGGFNAFAIISYDAARSSYAMQSYAGGRAGSFTLVATATGFEWTMPAGPAAHIRHVATLSGKHWHEDSLYEAEGKSPVKVFTMDLDRIGDNAWPGAGAVTPNP